MLQRLLSVVALLRSRRCRCVGCCRARCRLRAYARAPAASLTLCTAASRPAPCALLSGADASGVVPAAAFARDHEWVREYNFRAKVDQDGERRLSEPCLLGAGGVLVTPVLESRGGRQPACRGWGAAPRACRHPAAGPRACADRPPALAPSRAARRHHAAVPLWRRRHRALPPVQRQAGPAQAQAPGRGGGRRGGGGRRVRAAGEGGRAWSCLSGGAVAVGLAGGGRRL